LRPNTVFIDLEGGTAGLDVDRIEGVTTWAGLLDCLRDESAFEGVDAVCIDTVSRAEDMLREHVVAHVKTEKGASVTSLEGFGYGKGYVYMAEHYKPLLAALDSHHVTKGRDVILIAHERTGKVPNPKGDDYIRYEPRLLNSDKSSIMNMTKEWSDHVLFIAYDVTGVGKNRARGSGTRTIFLTEEATHVAKNRELGDASSIEYPKNDATIWNIIRGTAAKSVAAAPEF
jgi:hypothetical protein